MEEDSRENEQDCGGMPSTLQIIQDEDWPVSSQLVIIIGIITRLIDRELSRLELNYMSVVSRLIICLNRICE